MLNFNIYVREYDFKYYDKLMDFIKDSKQELCKTLSADEIHEIIINTMSFTYLKAYEIPIHISNI